MAPKPKPIPTKRRDDSSIFTPKRSSKDSTKKKINTNDNKVLETHNNTTPKPTTTDTDTRSGKLQFI